MPLELQCSLIMTSTIFAMLLCSIRDAVRRASFRCGAIRRLSVAVLVATIVSIKCCKCNAFVPYFSGIPQPVVNGMNEKVLRALAEAGAIKKVRVVAEGSIIYVEATTGKDYVSAKTSKGALKTWSTIDTASKWVRSLGLGTMTLDVSRWQPDQRKLNLR